MSDVAVTALRCIAGLAGLRSPRVSRTDEEVAFRAVELANEALARLERERPDIGCRNRLEAVE